MTKEQLIALKRLAKTMKYGSGPEHSKQVEKLSLKIYRELVRLGLLTDSKNDRRILGASALLHNIGLPDKKHNEAAFDILKVEIPNIMGSTPLAPKDLSAVLYCILWHRGDIFKKRGNIKIIQHPYVKKLASILRVSDAMDRSFQQIVEDVILNLDGGSLEFVLKSKYPVEAEIDRAIEKSDLLKAAFDLKNVSFIHG